ncbi:MAG: DEAD/DEAH box helicase [Acetilactobacillus jinshanensis]
MKNGFKKFGLKPFLLNAIHALHFKTPTKIQDKVIPVIQQGKSVVGQSATGSGKTHAYLLPIFNQLKLDQYKVQAVITTPSRELAYQLYDNAKQLAKYCPKTIHIADYIGGTDEARQIQKLHHHQPQIVIGTPGRILDLIDQQALDIHTADRMVIDEADMTLDMGFLGQIDQIATHFGKQLQMMVFSATIPQRLAPFLKKYMNHPEVEKVPVKSVINPNIDNWLMSTKGRDRAEIIYRLLTIGQPFLVLIFANTRQRVIQLTKFLRSKGLSVAMIEGGLQPRRRKRVMKQVRHLKYQFVVATDLAARGIDIDGVSMVINDQIPPDFRYFIHRVGRTGRNGMHGLAITLYSPDETKLVEGVKKMGVNFVPKEFKNGHIVDAPHRHRREHRRHGKQHLSAKMRGMISKRSKHVKPGYKHKIKVALLKNDEFNKKTYNRDLFS